MLVGSIPFLDEITAVISKITDVSAPGYRRVEVALRTLSQVVSATGQVISR